MQPHQLANKSQMDRLYMCAYYTAYMHVSYLYMYMYIHLRGQITFTQHLLYSPDPYLITEFPTRIH